MHKTKLQIIARLWNHVTDLLSIIKGKQLKTLEQVEREIDLTEYYCRPYVDCDDDELYALDVLRTAKKIEAYRSGESV